MRLIGDWISGIGELYIQLLKEELVRDLEKYPRLADRTG
jgi:hypothetical protein